MKQGFISGDLLDGKYRIENRLGQGGMGAVYRATHLGTKRTVAVKIIHPQFANHEEFVERFRREAEAAGRLRHPNVVDVTDFGFAQTAAGRIAYLVMEFLDGCTLADVLIEEGRLPTIWVVDILEQVCSAVDEAHRLGIIHRDLKPDNIWLEPNRRGGYTVKVLDFGLVKLDSSPPVEQTAPLRAEPALATPSADSDLAEPPTLLQHTDPEDAATLLKSPAGLGPPHSAKASEAAAPSSQAILGSDVGERHTTAVRVGPDTEGEIGLTRVGSLMGTPLYMSPEQCSGGRLDARSDIYSLGVIAYRLLCGETPFTGSLEELIKLHTTGEPQPVREKNSRVPRRAARLVMSALAKDPRERPESAAGFAAALRAGVEGSGALLRQAVSLYSERFPTFFKVSLLAYAPLIAVIAFLELSDSIISWERLTPAMLTLLGPLIVLGMITTNLLAYSITSALTVPLVLQLMIAPLRPVQLRTALETFRRRWLVFGTTSVVVLGLILVGAILFVLPGVAAAICFALYAPVAVIERSGVRATLKRAGSLVKRSWSTVLIITILQFTLPVLVWVISIDTSFTFKLDENFNPKEFSFYMGFADRSSLYQLLNIFVTPLTAIMTALLYLKTRRAGGESLQGAIEQFDALEIPRSKWEMRMRSRSVSPTPPPHRQDAEKIKPSMN